MAEKKQPIIIKKIYEAPAGGHGGAWKVAFADFMTAMMCFFLVMWLLNQSEPVKKQIASYFSGPSVLEQNFKSYGAELTFEKMFLDIINEPLKAVQTIMDPADLTPNILAMGSRKLILHHIANSMGQFQTKVNVDSDRVEIEIPDSSLFKFGTSEPTKEFVDIMERIGVLVAGLEDATLTIESNLYRQSVPEGTQVAAQNTAQARLDLIQAKLESNLEHDTVRVMARTKVSEAKKVPANGRPLGSIRITMAQREYSGDGHKPRKIEDLFSKERGTDMGVYDDFVDHMTDKKKKKRR